MSNSYFKFKQFTVRQDRCAMKVCTDSCLFGAWAGQFAGESKRILDIGAGTGLLMLMLAQQTSSIIDGIEIEPNCYEQLKNNLLESPWHDRLHAIAGDVREFQFTERYDLIISNPPFFASDLLSGSETNRIARHSTHLSLQELFKIAYFLLTSTGNMLLLIPYRRLAEVIELSSAVGFKIAEQVRVSHTQDHDPFRVFVRFSKSDDVSTRTSILVIKSGGSYSPEFRKFLQGYYLNL